MLASINTLQLSNTRPRSNTASSTNLSNGIANANDTPPQPQSEAPRVRPPHLRSRSYLSPVDTKSQRAPTTPADSANGTLTYRDWEREKDKDKDKDKGKGENIHRPWKHLPGHRRHAGEEEEKRSHLLTHRHSHGHRHTRSELPTHSRPGGGMSTGDEGGGDGSVGRNSTEASNANEGHLHPTIANLKGGMLTRMASNLSSRNPHTHPHAHGQQKPHHQYSSSDFHKGWTPTTQTLGLTGGLRPDIRRRATSDPKTPLQRYSSSGHVYTRDGGHPQFIGYGHGAGAALHDYGRYADFYAPQPERKPMTEIEELLYKAEKAQKEAEANVTEMDVQWLTAQLAESNVELQVQLARNNRTASDLTRRLDDAHDTLLTTASALNDTISSFQNLVTQSKTLNENFEQKAKELGKNTRKALEKRKKELFDARGEQVTQLEERGRKANEKAEELSQRLENCRTIVQNLQEREQTKKRALKGVLMGSLWGISLIVFGLFLGFGLWWWKNYRGIVQHGVHEAMALTFDRKGLGHMHGDDGDSVLGQGLGGGGGKRKAQLDTMNETERAKVLENVPEEVKAVLQDIASRHEAARHPQKAGGLEEVETRTQQFVQPSSDAVVEDDKKLKKLFERLEL